MVMLSRKHYYFEKNYTMLSYSVTYHNVPRVVHLSFATPLINCWLVKY